MNNRKQKLLTKGVLIRLLLIILVGMVSYGFDLKREVSRMVSKGLLKK